MPQLIIYPKDVVILHGIGYDAARRRIRRVAIHLGKPPHSQVTIAEYCLFYNLREAEVRAALV